MVRWLARLVICVFVSFLFAADVLAQGGWQPGDPLPPAVIYEAIGYVETWDDYRLSSGTRTEREFIPAGVIDASLEHDISVTESATSTGNQWGTGEATRDLSARLVVTTTSDLWSGSVSRVVTGDAYAFSTFDRSPNTPGGQSTGVRIHGRAGSEHVVRIWHRWKPVGWNPAPYMAMEVSGDLTTTSTSDSSSSPGADIKGQHSGGGGSPDRSFSEVIHAAHNDPYAFEYMGWLYRSFDDFRGGSPWLTADCVVVAYAWAGDGTVTAEATVSQQFNLTVERFGQELPIPAIRIVDGTGFEDDFIIPVGSTVEFSGVKSKDNDAYPPPPNSGIIAYYWSVETPNGPGTMLRGDVTTDAYTYAEQGEYTVSLTIVDDEFQTSTTSETVSVRANLPNAAATVTGEQRIGRVVEFDGSASADTDDDGTSESGIRRYLWYIIDDESGGEFKIGEGKRMPYVCDRLGSTDFRLVVEDDEGETDDFLFFVNTVGRVTITAVDDSSPESPVIEWETGDSVLEDEFARIEIWINDQKYSTAFTTFGGRQDLLGIYNLLDANGQADIEVRGFDIAGEFRNDRATLMVSELQETVGQERINVFVVTLIDVAEFFGVKQLFIARLAGQARRRGAVVLADILKETGNAIDRMDGLAQINDLQNQGDGTIELGIPKRTILWSVPGAKYDRRLLGGIRMEGVSDRPLSNDLGTSIPLFDLRAFVSGPYVGTAPRPFRPLVTDGASNRIWFLSRIDGFGKSGQTKIAAEYNIPRIFTSPIDAFIELRTIEKDVD